MNKQIEELVEWVADGIEVGTCCACGLTGEECDGCTWLPALDVREIAKKVLSHPDLALIEREKLEGIIGFIGQEFLLTKEQIGIVLLRLEQAGYIIPLAEALKERDGTENPS